MTISDPISGILGAWSAGLGVWSILLRLLLSIVFSAAIGCERAAKRHAAGLRTFIAVSLAGTVAMLVDMSVGTGIPVISAGVVIGGALLSGNSVLFDSRSRIRGLTTSTALWACGIMGLALGAGLYTVGLAGFLALLCVLCYLPPFEAYLKDRSNHFEIHLELKSKCNLQDFVATIRRLGLMIDDIESNPAYANSGLSVYSVSVTIASAELKKYRTHDEIIEALRSLDYISYIGEM